MSPSPTAPSIIDAMMAAAVALAVSPAAFASGAPDFPAAIIEAVGPPDKIVMGEPTISIDDAVSTAIDMIKASDFGKSPEGQNVIAKLEALDAAGKIQFLPVLSNPTYRGEWDDTVGITVHANYGSDPNVVASELVHEATHAVHEDEFPAAKSKLTIDEEVRTNINQLDFYEAQRNSGFRDPDLETRRADRAADALRATLRRRYPGVPEHL